LCDTSWSRSGGEDEVDPDKVDEGKEGIY